MNKKLLFFLLVVLIALPALSRDFEFEYEGQTLTYTVISEIDKTVMTKDGDSYLTGNSVSGNLIIPEIVKDGNVEYTVTSISRNAFYDCSGLTSVTIPNSVTSIGQSAFSCCSGLTSVIIPNSVTSIGNYAFEGCSGLNLVIIGNSVTSIGSSAFSYCSGLTSVTIPTSVTSIGQSAFEGCSGLKEILVAANNKNYCSINGVLYNKDSTILCAIPGGKEGKFVIPNSVTSIGRFAFSYCSGLTSVTIPESVTSIGIGAFWYCSGLTSVTIPESVKTIDFSAFSYCSGMTSVTIPNSVTSIGDSAFSYCSGLNSVTIPISVTSIGDSAFSYCSGLNSVIIPSSVTSIGNSAFSGCSGLTSVTITNSVTSIGVNTFRGCIGLTSVTIPESVKTIDYSAFWDCSGMKEILVAANNKNYCSINGVLYNKDATIICAIPGGKEGKFVIPNSVTSIGDFAFWGCSGLTSVTIPNSVTSIGRGAFWGCSGLTSVTIPMYVVSISDYAFAECNSISVVEYLSNNPVEPNGSIFNDIVYDQATLYVPERSVEIYENTFPWCRFHDIKGKDFSSIESVMVTDGLCDVYSMNGILIMRDVTLGEVYSLASGTYIIRQGNIVKKIAIK